jgi:putative transposase
MIVGYYVSFDPPGMLGTGICIANAILSKDAFLARLGLNYEWPCQGLPTIIHVDNAREFRGNTLKKSCEDYGIDLQFRKIKHPQYGGHIERMLGTLLMEMHEVPGTTFSNPMEKGEFDSAADAALTLDDFERWLANLVVGAYHNRVHSSLGMPPLVKFKQGILGSDDMPGTGVLQVATEPERLRINFLPMDTRTVQPSGIVVDKIAYYSDVLRHWIGALEPGSLRTKRKFLIRRDPRDISFIYFYDPDLEQYFRIPYRNATHPAISLWELRTIQRFLNEQGKKDEDEDAIFQALEEMVRIENAAVKATRKVRMADERRRRHKSHDATSVVVNDSFGQEEVDTQLGDDSEVLPFDDIRPM